MPDELKEAVQQQDIVSQLFKYIDAEHNPYRKDYLETVRTCNDFKELIQWNNLDKAKLDGYGVPDIPVDRINRGLDTIKGIWQNTGTKMSVQKVELGDEKIAQLLELTKRHVQKEMDFDDTEEDSFDSLLTNGLGVRKYGFDPLGDGGFGKFWCENINVEDVFIGYTKKRDFAGANYYCHHTIKTVEQATSEFPQHAQVIENMKMRLSTEWDKLKETNSGIQTSGSQDYGQRIARNSKQEYVNMIDFYEFWVQRVVPYKKVRSIVVDANGMIAPQVTAQPMDYQEAEGEELLAYTFEEQWWQYIIIGSEKNHEVLGEPKLSPYGTHPFVFECAERKKNGAPRGYVEMVIPHQVRINMAWAQKMAFNNKSIKTAAIVRGITDIDKAIKQTAIGAVLMLKQGEDFIANPGQPQVNLQAIEEGNIARADMDFASAATEDSLRGVASSGDSGIKIGIQQNAAVTPLNKWVKANKKARLQAERKLLRMIISEWGDKPEQFIRIVGLQKFMELLSPKINPMTGEMEEPPMQFPITVDAAMYDITVIEEAISDFNKQTTFNAVIAVHEMSGGMMFDDQFIIKSMPIKNTEDALASNQKKRNDILTQLMMQMQAMQAEMGEMQKQIPKGKENTANRSRGRNAPQEGKRSMLGGQKGVMGMGV